MSVFVDSLRTANQLRTCDFNGIPHDSSCRAHPRLNQQLLPENILWGERAGLITLWHMPYSNFSGILDPVIYMFLVKYLVMS